jgi:hypothetical protein
VIFGARTAGAFALGAIALGGACSHTTASVERLCTPGNYVFCRCKDLSQGTKLCNDDGQSFQPCSACQPGDEVPGTTDDLDADTPDTAIAKDASTADAAPVDSPPGVDKPGVGDVLITEVMYDPSGTEPDEEWIELYNASRAPHLLNGLSLKDGGNRTVTIGSPSPLVLSPGQYVVLVRDTAAATAAKVPLGAILLEYGAGIAVSQGVLLANGTGGAIWLMDGTTTISGAQYGGWFTQTSPGGSSIQLGTLTLVASGQQASWCLSQNAWSTGADNGTPGAKGDCP